MPFRFDKEHCNVVLRGIEGTHGARTIRLSCVAIAPPFDIREDYELIEAEHIFAIGYTENTRITDPELLSDIDMYRSELDTDQKNLEDMTMRTVLRSGSNLHEKHSSFRCDPDGTLTDKVESINRFIVKRVSELTPRPLSTDRVFRLFDSGQENSALALSLKSCKEDQHNKIGMPSVCYLATGLAMQAEAILAPSVRASPKYKQCTPTKKQELIEHSLKRMQEFPPCLTLHSYAIDLLEQAKVIYACMGWHDTSDLIKKRNIYQSLTKDG